MKLVQNNCFLIELKKLFHFEAEILKNDKLLKINQTIS